MREVGRTLSLSPTLDAEIRQELRDRGDGDWARGVLSMLDEAVRASRVPGIVFVRRRGERRAAIAFSGLEVWEIVATWREGGEDWRTLAAAYPELRESQLRAALAYHRLYPEEIDARLEREAQWTPERVAEEFPGSRPTRS